MGTIFDKVNFIISPIKSRIGEEITKKGQIVTTADSFQSYADKINAISTDATATAADILSGQTAYSGGSKITGTMTDRGAVSSTLTSQSQSYTVTKGYHNGSGTVKTNITNLKAANIKHGVNVGGVVGTLKSSTERTIAFTGRYSSVISGDSDLRLVTFIDDTGIVFPSNGVNVLPNKLVMKGDFFTVFFYHLITSPGNDNNSLYVLTIDSGGYFLQRDGGKRYDTWNSQSGYGAYNYHTYILVPTSTNISISVSSVRA